MKDKVRIVLVSLVLLSLATVVSAAMEAKGESQTDYRMWQFHAMKPDYIVKVMDKAKDYNINSVIFSHAMNYYLSDFDDRGSKLAQQHIKLAGKAHQLGLKVYIWPHELESVPDKFMRDKVVQLDSPGFFEHITDKYNKFFKAYPEFDGIVLTFHETKYKIFNDKSTKSKLSKPERFAAIINAINLACMENKRDFIVRSFLYNPDELNWFAESMEKVHPNVVLQSKCIPHDWQPFYPHNPMIGKFPDRKLIVEFDGSSEFTGKNRIPHTSPDYFKYRWDYDHKQPGVAGYNIRLDHHGYDAFFTPNELNIFAISRLAENPSLSSDDIWKEWTVKNYGEPAAPFVEKTLRPTFDCVNKAFFANTFWYTNHSKLPDYSYASRCIRPSGTNTYSVTITKWKPDDPSVKNTESALNYPTPEYLEVILKEKDEAISLADECMGNLQRAKPHLTSEQYDDLFWRINLLGRVTRIWKAHAEAFWGYKVLEQGDTVAGLRERINRSLDFIEQQAMISEKDPMIGDTIPASASNLRKVARELREKAEVRTDL